MSELTTKANQIATSKANIVTALANRGVTVSSATKLEDVAGLIDNMVVSGSGDSVLVTNMTGSNIAAGDKVFIKENVAVTKSKKSVYSNGKSVLCSLGENIFCINSIYDIENETWSTISTSAISLIEHDNCVPVYDARGNMYIGWAKTTNGVENIGKMYIQGDYCISVFNSSVNTFTLNKVDSNLMTTQSWTVNFPGTLNYDWMSWCYCVIGNKFYMTYKKTNYSYRYVGTIDDNSSTIAMSSRNDDYRVLYSTVDDKLAIGCYGYSSSSNYGKILSPMLISIDDSYNLEGTFISANTDLNDILSAQNSYIVFNRYTGILCASKADSSSYRGVFKYNTTTHDFDTVTIDFDGVSSASSGYFYLTISNDMTRMVYADYLYFLEQTPGGYKAIPYTSSIGSDVLTGFALEAAEPNDTFNVNTVVSGTSVDSKVIQANYNMAAEAHAGDKVFVAKGGAWAVEDDYVIDSLNYLIDSSYRDVWSGTLLDDVTTPGETVRVRLQGAKLPWVNVTVNTVPQDADVVITWSNRFIDDTGETVYSDMGNVDRVLTYTDLTIQASKSGYEDATEYVSVEDEDVTVNIELQPS